MAVQGGGAFDVRVTKRSDCNLKRGSIGVTDLHGMMKECAMGYLDGYRMWKGSVEA